MYVGSSLININKWKLLTPTVKSKINTSYQPQTYCPLFQCTVDITFSSVNKLTLSGPLKDCYNIIK